MSAVLIVEDETQVLILAESVLQHAEYETVSASTIAEAQAIINSAHELDLVFTDIGLRDHPEGGITIGQLVNQSRKGTPVLYTSGRAITDGMKALFVENSDFLPKPYTDHALIDAIAKLLRP
jgi:DNA-binding NtrC family response regulator